MCSGKKKSSPYTNNYTATGTAPSIMFRFFFCCFSNKKYTSTRQSYGRVTHFVFVGPSLRFSLWPLGTECRFLGTDFFFSTRCYTSVVLDNRLKRSSVRHCGRFERIDWTFEERRYSYFVKIRSRNMLNNDRLGNVRFEHVEFHFDRCREIASFEIKRIYYTRRTYRVVFLVILSLLKVMVLFQSHYR